jgi:hypothetical protein
MDRFRPLVMDAASGVAHTLHHVAKEVVVRPDAVGVRPAVPPLPLQSVVQGGRPVQCLEQRQPHALSVIIERRVVVPLRRLIEALAEQCHGHHRGSEYQLMHRPNNTVAVGG